MVLKAMTFRIVSKVLAGLACICVLAGLFALLPRHRGGMGDQSSEASNAPSNVHGISHGFSSIAHHTTSASHGAAHKPLKTSHIL